MAVIPMYLARGSSCNYLVENSNLDPLKLLEEMRAVQAYLAALADGETPPPTTSEPPDMTAFVASLSGG